MAYNVSNITAADGIHEIVEATNEATGGMVVWIILVSIFIINFLVWKAFDTPTVLLINSFIVMIISSLFVIGLGWAQWPVLAITMSAFAVMVLIVSVKKV